METASASESQSSSGATTSTTGTDGGIISRVRDRATAQLNTQKDRATDGIGNVAEVVRNATRQLREQHHEGVAEYIERSADQLERLSQRLRNKDVAELLRDAQSLARRQPALFIGSAFALGLLSARFLKSSSPEQQALAEPRQRWQRYGTGEYSAGMAAGRGATGAYAPQDRPGSPLSGLSDARTDRERYPDTTERY